MTQLSAAVSLWAPHRSLSCSCCVNSFMLRQRVNRSGLLSHFTREASMSETLPLISSDIWLNGRDLIRTHELENIYFFVFLRKLEGIHKLFMFIREVLYFFSASGAVLLFKTRTLQYTAYTQHCCQSWKRQSEPCAVVKNDWRLVPRWHTPVLSHSF